MKTKISKRIFAVLLTVVMLLSVAPLGGFVGLDLFSTKASAASYDVGDIIEFGHYPQNTVNDAYTRARLAEQTPDSFGRIYYNGELYFKLGTNGWYTYDPIKWRVLSVDSDGVYVIAENLLDCKPYHSSNTSITWAQCSLRTWLNGTFYDLAFSSNEKKTINTTHLVNGNNPEYGTPGGVATDDKVFLISLADALDSNYGFNSNASRVAYPTQYAKQMGLSAYSNGAYWFLRSPGRYSYLACSVSSDGNAYDDGNDVYRASIGVRPALKLNLGSDILESSSEYVIKIVNEETGAPVSGVTATVSGKTYTSDSTGYLKISAKSVVSNAAITLSKKNFETKKVPVSSLSKSRANIVTLGSKDPFNASSLLTGVNLGTSKVKGPSVEICGTDVDLFDIDLGLNIDIAKFSFKTDYDEKAQTYKVIIGMKDGVEVNNHDEFMNEYENFKDFFNISNVGTNYACRQAYNKIQDKLEKKKGLAGVEANLSVAGFMNFDVSTGKLKIIESGITVTGEVSYTQDFPFWYVFYATFTVGAEAGFTLRYNLSNTGSFFDGYNALISLALKAGLGVGAKAFSKKVASLELGLEGKLATTFAIPAESLAKSMTVKLTGDAYVKANLWKLSTKKTLEFGDGLQLYPKKSKAPAKFGSASSTAFSIDEEDFELTSRDYLNSRVSNKPMRAKAAFGSSTFTKTAVYPFGFPKIAALGDKLVAVWVEDDGTKTGANSNTLYYTEYNGTAWSSPAPIYESGKADFEAEIFSDGTNIYAVWQRASKVFDNDDVSIDDYADNTELVYSVYDGSSWNVPVVVGNSSVLATNYSITANGSDITVAWSENSENDYLCETGINSVYTQTFSSGEWASPVLAATEIGVVESLCVGVENSTVKTLYSVDGEVYDGATAITDDEIPDTSLTFQNGSFYWLSGGQLVNYQSSTITPVNTTAKDNYKILSNGTKTAVLTTVDDGFTNEIFVSYLEGEEFTAPLALTSYGKHISSYDAVINADGTITTVCDVENLSGNDGYPYTTTDMIIDKLGESVNLSLGENAFYDADSIKPGEYVSFSAELSNIGTADVDGYVIKLVNEAQAVLAQKTVKETLASGDSTEISIDYKLPRKISRSSVSVVVEAENDVDESNNVATAEYGFADIALENCSVSGDGVITALVVNNGYEAAENLNVSISKFNNSFEELTSFEFNSLEPGDSEEISYTIPKSELEFTQENPRILLSISATSDADELSLSDNSAELTMNPAAVTGVSLSKEELTLSVGDEYTLFANVTPIDAFNKNVRWISDYTGVASVDDNGVVTANGVGTATITVITEDGEFVSQCEVSVTEESESIPVTAIEISKTEADIIVGATLQLSATITPDNATNPEIIWTSSDDSIAQVTQSGLVIALKAGNASITAASADGNKTASCEIVVLNSIVPVTGVSLSSISANLTVGGSQQLTASVAPDDASNKKVSWTSSDESVATVSSSGLVTAVKAGTATITVTTEDGNKTASCDVTVSNSIVSVTGVMVSPTSKNLKVGETQQLSATVAPNDAANKNVSWTSSDESVATVNASGLVTAVNAGTATITVTTEDGSETASCIITVEAQPVEKTLSKIEINSAPSKTEYQYKEDGGMNLDGLTLKLTYSDGSTEIVNDTSKMRISNFTTFEKGDHTATVEFEGKTATFNYSVKYAWWQWIIIIVLFGFIWY